MSNHEDYSEESKTLADKKSSQSKAKQNFLKRSITLDCEDYADYFQKKMLSKKDSKNGPKKPEKSLKTKKESTEDGPKKKRGRPSKEDKKGTKDGNPINFEKGRFD